MNFLKLKRGSKINNMIHLYYNIHQCLNISIFFSTILLKMAKNSIHVHCVKNKIEFWVVLEHLSRENQCNCIIILITFFQRTSTLPFVSPKAVLELYKAHSIISDEQWYYNSPLNPPFIGLKKGGNLLQKQRSWFLVDQSDYFKEKSSNNEDVFSASLQLYNFMAVEPQSLDST